MPIELGGVRFPRVHRIVTLEQAAFAYHRIPGQDGNLVQNLGRDSVRLQIEGIFYGEQAKDGLAKLRNIYLKRTEVDFVADITGDAYVGKVTLDRLDVTQAADAPDQFSYILIVSEFVPPPKQKVDTAAIDKKAKLNAAATLELAALPDSLSLGAAPEVTNPFQPLSSALQPVQSATEALAGSMEGMNELLAPRQSAAESFENKSVSSALAEQKNRLIGSKGRDSSLPDLSNPYAPLQTSLEPIQSLTSDLVDSFTGLQELFGGES